jgi:murein DD-endopeptidase MepM/ murein hydrolase activator NlpD
VNVILFSTRFGTHHFKLGRTWTFTLSILGAGFVLAGIFFAGVQHGAQTALPVPADVAEANGVDRNGQRKLEALVARVAQLNAQIIRLDAMGRQITELARLDRGEFDFSPLTSGQAGRESEASARGQAPADQATGSAGSQTGGMGGPAPTPEDSDPAGEVSSNLDDLTSELRDREYQLGILQSMVFKRDLTRRLLPQGRPVAQGWISSHFGRRADPFTGQYAFHRGIDFAAPRGSRVLAMAPGVVIWARERSGYGQVVDIQHASGYVTRYAHNQKILVRTGDTIRKGQAISLIGSTGRSTGPHLHFEVLKDGRNIDPVQFVTAKARS